MKIEKRELERIEKIFKNHSNLTISVPSNNAKVEEKMIVIEYHSESEKDKILNYFIAARSINGETLQEVVIKNLLYYIKQLQKIIRNGGY